MDTKTTISLAFLGLVLSAVSGCTGSQPNPPQPTQQTAPQQPAQQQTTQQQTTQVPTPPPAITASPGDKPSVTPGESLNVAYLKEIYGNMSLFEKNQLRDSWANVKGSPSLEDVYLHEFTRVINESGDVVQNTGKPLTNAEARQFLDWVLEQ